MSINKRLRAALVPASRPPHTERTLSPPRLHLGSAAAVGFHVAGAHYFGIPLWYGLLFPVGYTAGAIMAIDSLRLRLSGRMSWKGRTYP